jgi:hypothetical protein
MTGGSGYLSEESQLAFQVCIQDGAPDAVLPQAAGQPRNPARRLAGLGNRGVDQKKVSDVFSPYISYRRNCSFRSVNYSRKATGCRLQAKKEEASGRSPVACGL